MWNNQWLLLHVYFAVSACIACSANLPKGLYILPMFCSYFLCFNGRLSNTCFSEGNGPIFTKISGLAEGCKSLFTSFSFFDFSRDVAMATN